MRPSLKPDTAAAERFFREVNIAFLVHELKDPLSIIESGAHQMLEKPDPQNPLNIRQVRTLQRVLRNSRKAREMLRELLEVGRAGAACFACQGFCPEPVVRQVLLEAVDSHGSELFDEIKILDTPAAKMACLTRNGVRLDVQQEALDIEIVQDEIKFRQIVGNLLKNALHFRRRQMIVHLACQHEHIAVAVRDDGPGIAPEHHEAIFQRYKQVNAPFGVARDGHGLGLAVARILARAMGGDIALDSQLGQGAMFRLTLPIRLEATVSPECL
jgi:two-component system OmpR family sensor kinase